MTSFPWASGAWHSSLPSSSRRKVGSDLLWLLNLRRIDIIVPMLVVADRHLRFPGRGAWFQYHRDQMLGPWACMDFLVLCGLGGPLYTFALTRYSRHGSKNCSKITPC